jgi:hypothetical protein
LSAIERPRSHDNAEARRLAQTEETRPGRPRRRDRKAPLDRTSTRTFFLAGAAFFAGFFAAGLAAAFGAALAALAFTCLLWRQTSESGAAAQTPPACVAVAANAASGVSTAPARASDAARDAAAFAPASNLLACSCVAGRGATAGAKAVACPTRAARARMMRFILDAGCTKRLEME